MLIGENAPISLERGVRGSHMEHAWDFYKPNLDSEYPLVDGKLSINLYLKALDECYRHYKSRFHAVHNKDFTLQDTDYALFHSPFTKLVRKSYARLAYDDFCAFPNLPKFSGIDQNLTKISAEDSYSHKDIQNIFNELSKKEYTEKVEPSLLLPKNLGNSYTGSLYTGLLSLISTKSDAELVSNY
jgi:hydroxymethylglutaryl-CoA synthase